jgi:hypothetical protein
LSFSLAQPITQDSTDQTETFRFNIGTTFWLNVYIIYYSLLFFF